jgi:hypothetical protein
LSFSVAVIQISFHLSEPVNSFSLNLFILFFMCNDFLDIKIFVASSTVLFVCQRDYIYNVDYLEFSNIPEILRGPMQTGIFYIIL